MPISYPNNPQNSTKNRPFAGPVFCYHRSTNKREDAMTEERRLLDMRRDGTLPEFVSRKEEGHTCTCGKAGNCPDCPNRQK